MLPHMCRPPPTLHAVGTTAHVQLIAINYISKAIKGIKRAFSRVAQLMSCKPNSQRCGSFGLRMPEVCAIVSLGK